MKLGMLGERTNSRRAAEMARGSYEFVSYPSIGEVFDALARGEVGRIIVPVKNSITGEIREYTSVIEARELRCAERIVIPIRHCLARGRKRPHVGFIASHKQALRQCARYLRKNYPGIYKEEMPSTEEAARFVAGIGLGAAIADAGVCRQYGLEIIATDIARYNFSIFEVVKNGKRKS